MTEWVLVIMMCNRMCIPTYAEVHPTKAACEFYLKENKPKWNSDAHCIPLLKNNK